MLFRSYDLLANCFELCDKYEKIFSRTDPDSELFKLNNGLLADSDGKHYISDELATVIQAGLTISKLSNGAFSIALAPLLDVWGFTTSEPALPNKISIDNILPYCDYNDIFLGYEHNSYYITFAKEGMGIDLGAISKGYIADQLEEYRFTENVTSAIINLGGNVVCIGEKTDHTPFQVGIKKPFTQSNEIVKSLPIVDKTVVTSGIYERYFTQSGTNYHHVLDSSSGYPSETNLYSTTIICDDSILADALSTACLALGYDKSILLLEKFDHVSAYFITNDNKIHAYKQNE